MKIAVAAAAFPHPEGSAAGRDLWAWGEAVRALGHELAAWVWYPSALFTEDSLPSWAGYAPVELSSSMGAHLRALCAPRSEAGRGRWRAPDDAVAVADQLASAGAVLAHPRSVVTVHYRALADARALRRLRPADIQNARAERRAGRRARLVLAYSPRVARSLGRSARFVPITCPMPAEAAGPVDGPVAGLLADWQWPPNRVALSRLMRIWPSVRDRVPGARLLLAGRNLAGEDVGPSPGVEVLGPVSDPLELLTQVAVVAFPVPASSGPKMKVLEALAHGLPVVTTPAGLEGLVLPEAAGAMAVTEPGYEDRLVQLLRQPERRAELGALGRRAVTRHHAPEVAARARLDAFSQMPPP